MTQTISLISVIPVNYSPEDLTYHEAVDWSYSNLSNDCVLQIDLTDIVHLSDVWDIINDINNSMIGPYEDGSVYLQKDRISILQKLKNYEYDNNLEKKHKEILGKIIELFELSIQTNRSIYFLF